MPSGLANRESPTKRLPVEPLIYGGLLQSRHGETCPTPLVPLHATDAIRGDHGTLFVGWLGSELDPPSPCCVGRTAAKSIAALASLCRAGQKIRRSANDHLGTCARDSCLAASLRRRIHRLDLLRRDRGRRGSPPDARTIPRGR